MPRSSRVERLPVKQRVGISKFPGAAYIVGWTGEVPAQAHNLNDVGSIPIPATIILFFEIMFLHLHPWIDIGKQKKENLLM